MVTRWRHLPQMWGIKRVSKSNGQPQVIGRVVNLNVNMLQRTCDAMSQETGCEPPSIVPGDCHEAMLGMSPLEDEAR